MWEEKDCLLSDFQIKYLPKLGEMMVRDTSWQKSSHWYDKHMKQDGGYNHRELILPQLTTLLNLSLDDSLLDLGCGQGILSRAIDPSIKYLGLDASKSLITSATKSNQSPHHHFKVQDVTLPLKTPTLFSHACFVLSLQNISNPKRALKNAASALKENGRLALVINHPCFRIPKHSSWEFLDNHKGQYRRVDRYLTPFKSSIQTNPSAGDKSPVTWSFHWPLSSYFKFLNEAGFAVDNTLEICSNRKSYGKAAASENFARKEFPLFMILSAFKRSATE